MLECTTLVWKQPELNDQELFAERAQVLMVEEDRAVTGGKP
jgi:hypothetical protein